MRLQKRGLAGTRWTDHREHLAGRDVERDVAQHGALVAVAEGDVLEGDATGHVARAGPPKASSRMVGRSSMISKTRATAPAPSWN